MRRRASLRIRRSRRDSGLRLLHHLRLLDIMMLPVLRRLDLVRERARRSRWMACDCQRTRPIRLHAGLWVASLGEYLGVLLLLQLRLLGMSRLLHVDRVRLPSGWLL